MLIKRIKNSLLGISGQAVVREAGLYGLTNLFNQLFLFLSAIVVTRYLGPTNLGILAFVQNYLLIFLTILAGSDYYYSWNLSRTENADNATRDYFAYRFKLSILLSLAGIFIAYFLFPQDIFVYILVVFIPIFLNTFNIFVLYALYEKRAKLYSSIYFAVSLVGFLLKVLLVYLSASLIYFILLLGLDIFLTGLAFFYYYGQNKIFIKNLFDFEFFDLRKDIKYFNLVKYSVLATLCWQLLLRVDQFMLAFISQLKFLTPLQNYSGAYNLGIYSAATKIAEMPNAIASIIYITLIGRLGTLIKDNNSDTKLRRVFILYVLTGLFLSVSISLLSPLIVNIVYGKDFAESIPVLQVYSWSIVGVYVIYYYFALLGAKNKNKKQSLFFIIGIIINIILIILLTPIYGLIGTAYATVISYTLVALFIYLSEFKNKNHLKE
ncbi:MAG: hypothetical protein QG614_586 [Patescibacteria group bacterium]|nr:hypothetical protein [Patescibacteria group bacterium]